MSSAEASVEDLSPHSSGDASGRSRKADPRLSALTKDVAEQDQAKLSQVILRDVAILAALLSLFAAAETWATASGLGLASLLSVVDGLLVGVATAGLLHEWGHFAGARLAGGHAPLKPIGSFPTLFDFDYKNNDSRAFDWMSIGGNAADIAAVLVLFFALPVSTPGQAALVAGAFGFAVFAASVEFPVIRKARSGMTGIQALSTLPRDFFARYSRRGAIAAAIAFVIL